MKFKTLDEEKIVSLKKKSNFLLPVPGGSLMISILRGSNPRTMEYECGISWDDLAKVLEAHGIDKKEIAKIPRQYMGSGYSLNSVAQYLNKVPTGKNAADSLMVAWGEWNKAIKTSDGIRFEEKETDEMKCLKEAKNVRNVQIWRSEMRKPMRSIGDLLLSANHWANTPEEKKLIDNMWDSYIDLEKVWKSLNDYIDDLE